MRLPIFLIAALVGALPFLAIPLMMALSDAGHVEAWRIVSGTVLCIWTPLWLMIGALASACASPATKQSQYAYAAPQAEPQTTPAHANDRWTVISPTGQVFTGESPFRAASAANKQWVKTDPEAAKRFADMIERIRVENEAENTRLLAEHGTLNCPACGGSGHIGDVSEPEHAPLSNEQLEEIHQSTWIQSAATLDDFARATEQACANKWGIKLAGIGTKGGDKP